MFNTVVRQFDHSVASAEWSHSKRRCGQSLPDRNPLGADRHHGLVWRGLGAGAGPDPHGGGGRRTSARHATTRSRGAATRDRRGGVPGPADRTPRRPLAGAERPSRENRRSAPRTWHRSRRAARTAGPDRRRNCLPRSQITSIRRRPTRSRSHNAVRGWARLITLDQIHATNCHRRRLAREPRLQQGPPSIDPSPGRTRSRRRRPPG